MQPNLSPHTVVIENDLIWVTVRGELSIAQADLMNPVFEKEAQEHGYLLTLIDVTEARMLSQEVRKKAVEDSLRIMRKYKIPAASAAYGAGLIVTALVSLMYSAIRVLTGEVHKNKIVRTESEARAFLDEQRRQFRRELGHDRNS